MTGVTVNIEDEIRRQVVEALRTPEPTRDGVFQVCDVAGERAIAVGSLGQRLDNSMRALVAEGVLRLVGGWFTLAKEAKE